MTSRRIPKFLNRDRAAPYQKPDQKPASVFRMASCFPRSARSTSFLASFNFLGAQYKIGATSGATPGQPAGRNDPKREETDRTRRNAGLAMVPGDGWTCFSRFQPSSING